MPVPYSELTMNIIKGGITAPKGFLAGSVSCGIKKSGKNDLALLYSEVPGICTGTFTTNRVKSGSLVLSMQRVKKGIAQAVIVNSGNANCCVGKRSVRDAEEITDILSEKLNMRKDFVLMASTGIIGRPLPAHRIAGGLDNLIGALSCSSGHEFAKAIMTTDTVPKEIAVEIKVRGRLVRVAGACKGAGMIHPKMATMLAFFTTDAAIEKDALRSAFREAIENSFNRISVDGDMSTNDTAIIFANGLAGNRRIRKGGIGYKEFSKALNFVTQGLAKKIVFDGEGATKFIEITVRGCRSFENADKIARRIANSNLVKTMIAGGDPNWGRIASAAGSSGIKIDPRKLDIYFGNFCVMKQGSGTGIPREKLLDIFKTKNIAITVDVHGGKKSAAMWTCDLTEEYVRINAEYET